MLLLVISIPTAKEEPVLEKTLKKEEQMIPEENPEQRLKEVLQKIKGVGRVEILITYEDKGRLVVEKDEIVSEATEALVSLGYTQKEIVRVIKSCDLSDCDTTEDVIKIVLKNI